MISVDNREIREIKAAEQIYNSYLLLYKLNKLETNTKKSLQEIVCKAIDQKKAQEEFKIEDKQYKIQITEQNNQYKLTILGKYTKPEVKDILEYTDRDIIALWAESEVFLEKDSNNNWAFAVGIQDEVRQKNLKVGGLGKKVPFSLRFANFHKVVKMLKDENVPLQEKLRLANNISTGSGKTGDIALLKLWSYLCDIPCITMVPSDTLKSQSIKFDKEFLPDEVEYEFAKPLCKKEIDFKAINSNLEEVLEEKHNTKHVTATFKEAFNEHWNILNNIYGKDRKEPALICIDEAPKLRENPVFMARAIEMSRDNPIAIFSAVPDNFLSDQFKIKEQILLSPKEREALGVGKLPNIFVAKGEVYDSGVYHAIMKENKKRAHGDYVSMEEQYAKKCENTHVNLNKSGEILSFKRKVENADDQEKSQLFLDLINQTLDSQAYKVGLIVSEQKYFNEDSYVEKIVFATIVSKMIINNVSYGTDSESKRNTREEERKKSFIKSIKELNIGLSDKEIECFVTENLNTNIGSKLLSSIKLHSIIDTFNEYRRNKRTVTQNKVNEFIQKKYDITDTLNLQLTEIILKLDKIYQDNPDLEKSFIRNYEGDKKLHDCIFQDSDIKAFCEKDVIISYFNGEIRYFNAKGAKEEPEESNAENILNFARAGFIPRIISKELAIGIDAPRLGQAAIIAKGATEILDPNFLLQFIGRVGRDINRKGECYVDSYVAEEEYVDLDKVRNLSFRGKKYIDSIPKRYREFSKVPRNLTEPAFIDYRFVPNKHMHYEIPSYLDLEKINTLSKKEFFEVIVNGHEKYYNDEISIFSIYSSLLSENICSIVRESKGIRISKKDVYEKLFKSIKDTFKTININFNYDKERALDIFYHALMKSELYSPIQIKPSDTKDDSYSNDYFFPQSMASFIIKALEDAIKKGIVIKSTITPKYHDNMLPQDWWQCIAGTNPIKLESLVDGDPNSNAPIFMEQKKKLPSDDIMASISIVNKNDANNKTKILTNMTVASNNKSQQTSPTRKAIYATMIVSPFIATGIYAVVTISAGVIEFNPIVAAGIFVGVAALAVMCFVAVKVYDKVSEEKDKDPNISTCTALKNVLTPECLKSSEVAIS